MFLFPLSGCSLFSSLWIILILLGSWRRQMILQCSRWKRRSLSVNAYVNMMRDVLSKLYSESKSEAFPHLIIWSWKNHTTEEIIFNETSDAQPSSSIHSFKHQAWIQVHVFPPAWDWNDHQVIFSCDHDSDASLEDTDFTWTNDKIIIHSSVEYKSSVLSIQWKSVVVLDDIDAHFMSKTLVFHRRKRFILVCK